MSFTTILLLLLVVGYSLYTKASKTAAAAMESTGKDSSEEEQDGMLFDETPLPENDNEYFTYETEVSTTPKRKVSEYKPRPAAAAIVEEPAAPQFDLRQAVIAQVILDDKYINEINQ